MNPLIAAMVEADPDAPAVTDDRRSVTWTELDERSVQLVGALRERGLGVGDRIAAMLGNQVEMVELSLACCIGGFVLVPLNWHWVAPEVAYVLDDAQVAAVVVDERWVDVVVAATGAADAEPIVRIGVGDAVPASWERFEDVVDSDAGAADDLEKGGPMFYTSGTTGQPKGVRSTLTSVGGSPELFVLMAHSMGPVLGVPPGAAPAGEPPPVQLICGPMYHSAQWVFAHFTLMCGAALVLQHRFDADELLRLVDEHSVTNLHLVPTQMSRILALPADRRDAFSGASLRSVMHGAAPCPPWIKRSMIEWWGPLVTEYYGGTEGGFISVIEAEEWLDRPTSVGRPLPVIELGVHDVDGAPLGIGQVGEIWFRNLLGSDFEYHNAPDKTASSHRLDGAATLGDVGFLDADGYLHLADRKIDMIVSGGVNIYPAEVEGVVGEHPAVADIAVFGIPDDEMGEAVHAVIALAPDATWSGRLAAELDAWCIANMAGYKRPRSWEVVPALPRSAAGKLLKRELRDRWWADLGRRI